MVVNGGSLDWALENVDSFLDLALYCQSVIICRASPLQKAKVVKFIKEGERAITLSIGDGANDVSMIQVPSPPPPPPFIFSLLTIFLPLFFLINRKPTLGWVFLEERGHKQLEMQTMLFGNFNI